MLDIEEQSVRVAHVGTSVVDVPGQVCKAVFFSGCSIKCEGCQNKGLWDEKAGSVMTVTALAKKLNTDFVKWIALMGGEPTDQTQACVSLMKLLPDKKFCLYTGRNIEDINTSLLLPNLLLIKEGSYRKDLPTGKDSVLASKNQRFLARVDGVYLAVRRSKKKLVMAIEKL